MVISKRLERIRKLAGAGPKKARKPVRKAVKKKPVKPRVRKAVKKPVARKPPARRPRKPVKRAVKPRARAKPRVKPKAKPKPRPRKPVKPVRARVKPRAPARPKVVKPVKPEKPEPAPASEPMVLSSKFHIKVENVVAFASLGKDIPLEKLVSSVENTEYEPEQFPGLVYRSQNPRAAALIFSSGKIVCTGAKSIENAKLAMRNVVDRIRKAGIDMPTEFHIKVENIVASSKIKAQLNLEEIAFALENAEYEPEQFPGLVYRISEPRVAFLLFSSGKIICTGAHSLDDIDRALGKLKERLESIGVKVTPVAD